MSDVPRARPPSFQRRLESSVRDSGAHTGRRGGRVVSSVPAPSGPVIPAKAGIPVRDSGAHTGRRSGRVVSDVERAPSNVRHGERQRPAPGPVIPAKAGIQRARQRSAHAAEGRKGCVRGWSQRRANPRHSSEGWNPACATAERTRGGGAEGLCARFLSPAGPLALWERVRVRVATNDNCPLRHRRPNPYIGRIRRSRRTRIPPSCPAKAGIQRARQRSAHGAEPLGRVVSEVPVFQRGWKPPRMRVRRKGNATECNQMQLN